MATKESRRNTLKIAVCLIAAALIQTALPQLVPAALGQWLGHVDWLLLVVIYVCLQRSPAQALITAGAAGLLQDLLSLSSEVALGVSGLAYVLAAYVADRIVSVIVADNLLVRVATVAAGSVVSLIVRISFYRLLKFKLPALADGQDIAAAIVFGLFANLIVSILLYLLLDRFFSRNAALRSRRTEARRIRTRL